MNINLIKLWLKERFQLKEQRVATVSSTLFVPYALYLFLNLCVLGLMVDNITYLITGVCFGFISGYTFHHYTEGE